MPFLLQFLEHMVKVHHQSRALLADLTQVRPSCNSQVYDTLLELYLRALRTADIKGPTVNCQRVSCCSLYKTQTSAPSSREKNGSWICSPIQTLKYAWLVFTELTKLTV